MKRATEGKRNDEKGKTERQHLKKVHFRVPYLKF